MTDKKITESEKEPEPFRCKNCKSEDVKAHTVGMNYFDYSCDSCGHEGHYSWNYKTGKETSYD